MITRLSIAHERAMSGLTVRTHHAKELPVIKKPSKFHGGKSHAIYLYERVRALKAEGMSRLHISARLGISTVTVSKYANMEKAPE
jgi:hypothetical protein